MKPLAVLMALSVAPACCAQSPSLSEPEQLKQRVAQLEAEVRELKKAVEALKPKPAGPLALDLQVAKDGWAGAPGADVRAVCLSAAMEIRKHLPERSFETISITYSKQGPMAVYGFGSGGERRVLLNTQETYWSQYAYQFAHEFCHIACNYRDSDKSNHWFEESLCETASIFALRRMAETWKTKAPYPNWTGYSKSLQSYVDDHMKKYDALGELTLAEWYRRNEDHLRKNSTDRPKNQVVAAALLPLFEKNPEHWAALGSLNQWEKTKVLTWKEYLADWHARVPAKHKGFVKDVAGMFELKVD
jgi:hypothetical protein